MARTSTSGKGRPAGVPNKLTLDLKEALRPHIQDTVRELIRLSKSAENETVRLKAGEIVLERFYGRVPQALVGADGGAIKIEHTRSKVEAEVDLLLHPPEKSAEDRVH